MVDAVVSKSLLEQFPKYLALLGPFCIGFSVVYDWGYLYGLGLSFREVPTTIADHLRSAIIWLPYAIVNLTFVVALGIYLGQRDAAHLSNAEYKKRKELLDNLLWVINGGSLIAAWVLLGDRMVALAAFGLGQLVVVLMLVAERGAPKGLRQAYTLGGFSFLFASCLFASGNIGATSKSNSEPTDELIIKNVAGTETVKGRILRRFEQCLIIVNDKHVVSLIKPDDLVRVTLSSGRPTNKGMLCNSFDVACSELPGASKPASSK